MEEYKQKKITVTETKYTITDHDTFFIVDYASKGFMLLMHYTESNKDEILELCETTCFNYHLLNN
jgi:hypothetical protein